MGHRLQNLGILLALGLMLFSFQNCGQQGQFTGLEAIPVGEGQSLQLDEFVGIRVANPQLVMNSFQNHIEVTGTCNIGGSIENRISYYLTSSGIPVSASVVNLDNLSTDELPFRSGICQNGRWHAFVLRQNADGTMLAGGTTYQAYFTLELRSEGQTFFTKGPTSSPVEIVIYPTN